MIPLARWEEKSKVSTPVDHGQAYGVVFIRNVKHKHTVAKKYFSKIPVMAKYLQEVDLQSATHGNLLVAKPINTVTARILTTIPQAAAGKATQ